MLFEPDQISTQIRLHDPFVSYLELLLFHPTAPVIRHMLTASEDGLSIETSLPDSPLLVVQVLISPLPKSDPLNLCLLLPETRSFSLRAFFSSGDVFSYFFQGPLSRLRISPSSSVLSSRVFSPTLRMPPSSPPPRNPKLFSKLFR